jgi:phosphate starvation-inducible membrane PsiE
VGGLREYKLSVAIERVTMIRLLLVRLLVLVVMVLGSSTLLGYSEIASTPEQFVVNYAVVIGVLTTYIYQMFVDIVLEAVRHNSETDKILERLERIEAKLDQRD